MKTGRGTDTRTGRWGAGTAVLFAGVALLAVAAGRLGVYLDRAPRARFPGGGQGAPRLYLLFQPGDCVAYGALVERWDRLHREGVVRVRGVELRPGGGRDGADDPGVSFPVRPGAGEVEAAALRLGYGRTPLSVLVDREGRPRLVVPPVPGRDGQEAAETMVRRYAERLLAEGG